MFKKLFKLLAVVFVYVYYYLSILGLAFCAVSPFVMTFILVLSIVGKLDVVLVVPLVRSVFALTFLMFAGLLIYLKVEKKRQEKEGKKIVDEVAEEANKIGAETKNKKKDTTVKKDKE